MSFSIKPTIKNREFKDLHAGLENFINHANQQGELLSLPVEAIIADDTQPRKYFDLDDLIESITKMGIITPLIVREVGEGRYKIVEGERRFRAAKTLNITEIPAIINTNLTDDDKKIIAEIQYEVNQKRKNLTPLEDAAWHVRYVNDFFGGDRKTASTVLNCTQAFLSNRYTITSAPEELKEFFGSGKIYDAETCAVITRLYKNNKKTALDAIEKIKKNEITGSLREHVQNTNRAFKSPLKKETALETRGAKFIKFFLHNKSIVAEIRVNKTVLHVKISKEAIRKIIKETE